MDEMSIQESLIYDKKTDMFVGKIDMKVTDWPRDSNKPHLANRLLCFIA